MLANPMIWGVLTIALAGFTQGLTSFGFALISMPILSAFLPLQEVVPVIVILSLCSNVMVLGEARSSVDLRRIGLLLVPSLAAAPFGVYLLRVMPASMLKLFIGLLILLFALLLLRGVTFKVRHDQLACIPVGMASGLLNGSISLSGPPVALFLSSQGVEKQVFRAQITAYALILNVMTVFTFWYTGAVTAGVVHDCLWFLPTMFVGVYAGVRAIRRISDRMFKKLTLYLLILSGLWTLFAGLHA